MGLSVRFEEGGLMLGGVRKVLGCGKELEGKARDGIWSAGCLSDGV
jgi:hypothetical protein